MSSLSQGSHVSEVVLYLDESAHSADAIQRAAYRFADRLALELSRDGPNYRCVLRFGAQTDPAADTNDFLAEVVDQSLRERIREETAGVRNLILSLAFSNTGLIEPTAE